MEKQAITGHWAEIFNKFFCKLQCQNISYFILATSFLKNNIKKGLNLALKENVPMYVQQSLGVSTFTTFKPKVVSTWGLNSIKV